MSGMNKENKEDWTFIKKMLKKYWYLVIIFVALVIGAIIGFILTLFLVLETSAIGGNGTWFIGEFSIANIIILCLWILLWEFLIVVLPTIVVMAAIGGTWWMRLPEDQKEEIRNRDKKEKKKPKASSGGSGAFGFFTFIAFIIILAIDGTLDTPLGDRVYTYWIIQYLWAAFWVSIIFGIPALIGGSFYLYKKLKEV